MLSNFYNFEYFMTKKSIIIANWKMKMNLGETVDLTQEIVDGFKEMNLEKFPEVVLCPSFIAAAEVGEVLSSTDLKLGAQDVFWRDNGAYTGEISIEMLKELECEYFIIGHSERRQYLQETDEMINNKLKAVFKAGLVPIVCVGETREERTEGKKDYVVGNQIVEAFKDINLQEGQKAIVAYEPVWVIGTGQAVELEEVKYMTNLIRHAVLDFCFNKEDIKVIYGGSVDSNNIGGFIEGGGVDGFLVGTAALDAGEFLRMIKLINSPNF